MLLVGNFFCLSEEKLTAENTTTVPNAAKSSSETITSVRRHGGLDDLQGLAEGGDLEQVQTGAQEQVGKLDGLLLELGRLGSRERGGNSGGHDLVDVAVIGALTKGKGCFVAGSERERRERE